MSISKSRTFQLMYQSCYFALSVVAVFGSIGLFQYEFVWDFYIYFTNLSNYLCSGIMLAELVQTARKKEDSYVDFLNPEAQGIGGVVKWILILLIFFIAAGYVFLGIDRILPKHITDR